MSTESSPTTTSLTLSGQLLLNLLCSRARATIKEATSDHRKTGPSNYYKVWRARMKMEMVSTPRVRHNPVLVHYLHLTAQETAEVYLGFMLMRNRYHYVVPFHKQVHRTLRRLFGLIEEFKSALSDLDYNCPANDPTRIIDGPGLYLSLHIICLHLWLNLICVILTRFEMIIAILLHHLLRPGSRMIPSLGILARF